MIPVNFKGALNQSDRVRITVAAKPLPPAEYLRQCFAYDAETGILTWRERPREHFPDSRAWRCFNTKYAGRSAGNPERRGSGAIHIRTKLDGRAYWAHRLIWKLVKGFDPIALVDHKDGDGTNNRILNLRAASLLDNGRNKRTNRDGLKGTSFFKNTGKWVAKIRTNNKHIHLGTFATEAEAHAAYCIAAKQHFGEFARFE